MYREYIDKGRFKIQNHLEHTFEEDIRNDVYTGLTSEPKKLSSRYFYDTRGSQLFENICLLPEYYQTRTELSILRKAASEIIGSSGYEDLIELGSGENLKVRTLIDAANAGSIRYVPVDVSESALIEESIELLETYPDLSVTAILADFTRHLEHLPAEQKKLITFFGSTIGNLDKEQSSEMLKQIARAMTPHDSFLIGIDMVKPLDILESAYNDSQGITSEFNKNILNVINRELNANFNPNDFAHLAFFNKEQKQIEMHLRANQPVTVRINNIELEVQFKSGETIRTEISRKFTRKSAEKMFSEAGMEVSRWFTDANEWFSLVELKLSDAMPDRQY